MNEVTVNYDENQLMWLIDAIARCHEIGVKASVYYRRGNILSYYFDFGDEYFCDCVCEIGPSLMKAVDEKISILNEARREAIRNCGF